MSGIDLTVSIIIWGLIILNLIFHICCAVYAWHHLDAEDVERLMRDIEAYNTKRRAEKAEEAKIIDKMLGLRK